MHFKIEIKVAGSEEILDSVVKKIYLTSNEFDDTLKTGGSIGVFSPFNKTATEDTKREASWEVTIPNTISS